MKMTRHRLPSDIPWWRWKPQPSKAVPTHDPECVCGHRESQHNGRLECIFDDFGELCKCRCFNEVDR